MANFTQSVREIIQQNASGQDISTIEGIFEVGSSIFFGSEMNVISNDYRERFEKGFLLKYFNDELGYETFPLWRIAFQEKIYNNADYINLIYDTLDKQIFADYRVKKTKNNGTASVITDVEGGSTTVTDGTVEVSNEGTTAETTQNRNVVDEDTTDSSSSTTLGTGTVANAKTGTETTEDTGTVANAKTGTETTADTGTDATAHTGTKTTTTDIVRNEQQFGSYEDTTVHGLVDTNTKTGTETKVIDKETSLDRTGTETRALSGKDQRDVTVEKLGSEQDQETKNLTHGESGSYRDTHHQTVDTENDGRDNGFQVNYDTPQGSISNMRSPGASSAGKGASMLTDENFNYMTAALENGNTHIDDNTETTDGYTERTFNSYNQTDTGTDTNVKSFTNRKDVTDDDVTYGKTDTLTLNTSDDGTEDVTDTTTYNTTDRSTKTGTDTTTRSYGNDFRKVNDEDGSVEDEYDETTTETKNLQSQTTHNTTDTETRNLQSETTHNTTDTETRNTSDATTGSATGTRDVTTTDNGTRNVTDESSQTTDTDTTVTNTNESNTTQNTTKADTGEEIDYSYNLELIYRSMPLLNKVWEIFDDLFMFIYS